MDKQKAKKAKPGWRLEFNQNEFPRDIIERFILAVEGIKEQIFVVERPMTKSQAAEFLSVSSRTIENMASVGVIRSHYFDGFKIPYFIPSEILEDLKKGKEKK